VAKFLPAGSVRGSVVLSTGRTEPIEKYGEVAADLVSRGFAVLTHDWAGQGLSGRFLGDTLRGDIDGGWRAFLSDYADIVSAYESELPRPWIAMAHSMGGALTALALTEVDVAFDAAVLCAPMMQFSTGQIPMCVARSVVALHVLLRRETSLARAQLDPLALPFEDNPLTHDRARYQRTRMLYRAHPELRIGEPTWRWLKFGIEIGDRLASPGAAERIWCPLTIVAAGNDRVVRNGPIRRFIARVPRGRYVEVPGAFHEILMEEDVHRARFFEEFDRLADELTAQRTLAASA
jgi:lysophospholipase